MTATPAEVVARSGLSLPEAHTNPASMAGLRARRGPHHRLRIRRRAALRDGGGGSLRGCHRPWRRQHRSADRAGALCFRADRNRSPGRGAVAARPRANRRRSDAVVAETAGDLPIIANLIGPVSVAASIVDPLAFLAGASLQAGGDGRARRPCDGFPDRMVAPTHRRRRRRHRHPRRHHNAGACRTEDLRNCRVSPSAAADGGYQRRRAPSRCCTCAARSASLPPPSPARSRRIHPGCFAIPGRGQAVPAGRRRGGQYQHLPSAPGSARPYRQACRAPRREGGVDALSPTCGMSSATPLVNILAMTGAAQSRAEGS